MTMIECRECKRAVSDEAKACPHCGAAPQPPVSAARWGLRLLGALVAAALVLAGTAYYAGRSSSAEAVDRVAARMAEMGHPEASPSITRYVTRGSTTYTCLAAHYKDGAEDRVKLFVVLQTGAMLDFLGMHEEGEKTFGATYTDVCM